MCADEIKRHPILAQKREKLFVQEKIYIKHPSRLDFLKKRRDQFVNLLSGIETMRKPPVYIVGLPRSGTTWIASVINTARSVKYFHEPFNCSNFIGASRFCMKYLVESGDDVEFARYCSKAFKGEILSDCSRTMLAPSYRRYPQLPGRVVVKDVCSCLAVECVESLFDPMIVLVIRHPCAVAASWHRLDYDIDRHLEAIRIQPQLNQNFLHAFQSVLRDARSFWQKIGAVWGAVYYVLSQQQKTHPMWKIVQHEVLCENPVGSFRDLFETLDLTWTDATDAFLCASTKFASADPYTTRRISANEPDKWRKQLDRQQIKDVLNFVQPFGIPLYSCEV